MVCHLVRDELIAVRNAACAALVGICRRVTFVLRAAVCRLAIKRPSCEAVEGPGEQEDCQNRYRNVDATMHLISG
jgi:hypothetical protein